MQLTISFDSKKDTADDYRRAIRVLSFLGGIGGDLVSVSGGGIEITGDAAETADAVPNPATLGFGKTESAPGGAAINDASAAANPPGLNTEQAALLARVELDPDGLPWDGRIHAATKTRNADKRWKKKKGVDEATVKNVQDELLRIMALVPRTDAAAAPPPPPPPTTGAAPPPPPPTTGAAPPPPPPPTTAATTETAATPMTFPKLVAWLAAQVNAGKLTAESVADTMVELGLVDNSGAGQMTLLASRPDMVQSAYDKLAAKVAA